MLPGLNKLLNGADDDLLMQLSDSGFAEAREALASLRKIARLNAEVCRLQRPDRARDGSLHDPGVPWFRSLDRVLREAPLKEAVLRAVVSLLERSESPRDVLQRLEQSPRAFDILGRLACGSPFLTSIVLTEPDHLFELASDRRTAEMKSRDQFIDEGMLAISAADTRETQRAALRRLHRRELLRIGLCDAFGLLDLRFVTLQLSLLADAIVQCCLNMAVAESGCDPDSAHALAFIALGKLGGEELNYSSDIDLLLVSKDGGDLADQLARRTIDALTDNVAPGFLYRVDLRLRPWGHAGPLVSTVSSAVDYFAQDAALWEKQAMLKARVIAGDKATGHRLLSAVRPLLFNESAATVRSNIQQMKERIEARLRQRGRLNMEVKLGVGSIRDVEFLVQSLQLIHGEREPRILTSNTLEALVRLAEFGLISAAWYRQLRAGYVFLRTIEHSLQLSHNLQTHELPADPRQLEWLANRLDYPDASTLLQRYAEHRTAVRTIFETGLQSDALSATAGALQPRHDAPGDSEPRRDTTGLPESERVRRQLLVQDVLDRVTNEQPAIVEELSGATQHDSDFELVIAGVEFSGWLSVICGLLSALQLDIRRGDALTGEGENRYGVRLVQGRFLACFEVRRMPHKDLRAAARGTTDRVAQRSVLKKVSGTLEALSHHSDSVRPESSRHLFQRPDSADGPGPRAGTAGRIDQLRSIQDEMVRLGQLSRDGRIDEVRSEMLRRFCAEVPRFGTTDGSLPDVQIELSRVPDSVLTRVRISGTDSWGFLYELASALSLSRFRVRKAVIESDGTQVRDVLFVRERSGRPIDRDERLQELMLAATLVKQFMHWLPTASDPYSALTRFRELLAKLQPGAEWPDSIRSLQRPGVLAAMARVLGVSQYLWESFLRSQHEQLIPLLANPVQLAQRICRDDLMLELTTAIDEAPDAAEGWSRLNAFKDRHLFRIDLRHVLGHCRPFGAFSEELTELAEIVVAQGVELALRQLIEVHGPPCAAGSTRPCEWAIAGLGKFGGIEMGFASDIELMLIYSTSGQTTGRHVISNSEFFDRVVGLVASGIVAPQDGIFHVDLRLRPFGQAGIGAVSLSDFVRYYAPHGPAWPFERQGLTRFRCVDGDPAFCSDVTAACQRAIYSSAAFDFKAMHAMRERQVRQLVRGGTINAKLSEGGIVDCEYAVQALQLTFGTTQPSLRRPTTLQVLQEAANLNLIPDDQARDVELAYVFLRQLIDCLRLVRGNARDLTVPLPDSRDWQQLAHRMVLIHDSPFGLDELEHHMRVVREFSADVERICRAAVDADAAASG